MTTQPVAIETPQLDQILFIEDLAERLRRSKSQIRWMIQQGTAPKHAKIAGRICFKSSDVEAYIEAAFSKAD